MRVARKSYRRDPNRPRYAVVPRELVENPQLSDAACRLFAALDSITLGHKDKQVTLQRLAEQMGWSRSKMTRAVKQLEDAGLIKTQRTFRSPKVTVQNPVRDRAAAPNGTAGRAASSKSHASPVKQELSENQGNRVTSEAPSCVTSEAPIQEYRKENTNKQSTSGVSARATRRAIHNAGAIQKTEKTAATIFDAGEVENYLAAIADRTGHLVDANKSTRPLIAAIAARGITASDAAQLVDAELAAAGPNIKNPSGFIVKIILPALAGAPIQEPPKPTPTPRPYSELKTATPCPHGDLGGPPKCALCRTENATPPSPAPATSPATMPAEISAMAQTRPGHDWMRELVTALSQTPPPGIPPMDLSELPSDVRAEVEFYGLEQLQAMYGVTLGTAA